MPAIALSTINAKYIHASLGLRYLYANMGDLRVHTALHEFTLDQKSDDIAEILLQSNPVVIGFGVYIWNTAVTLEVIKILKTLRPDLAIVIGGPEVSYEQSEQPICKIADHIITGQADLAFADLCREILNREIPNRDIPNRNKLRHEKPAALTSPLPFSIDELASPYPYYSDEDLQHRILYVEASRGCPFKCEFCLSSLDKTATAFELDSFIGQLDNLVKRGARNFKFVDRTFNLKAKSCRRILEYFLEQQRTPKIDSEQREIFLHFELIPDRLPETVKELLPLFKPGSLQFEIGIQSFNPEVQQLISRGQQHERTCENLSWLRANTTAHIHADLIVGLPGEDIDSFAAGFDLLYSLGPQEIQVGILKRLRGTPIDRHTIPFDMRYARTPPYRILSTGLMNFETLQRMVRFARYWDLIGNSGRFPATLPLLLDGEPFQRFLMFSDWLFDTSAQTHRISLPRLFNLIFQGLQDLSLAEFVDCERSLVSDFRHNKLKGLPGFLKNLDNDSASAYNTRNSNRQAKRQDRHERVAL